MDENVQTIVDQIDERLKATKDIGPNSQEMEIFNNISKSVIELLQGPVFSSSFRIIQEKCGTEVAESIISLMSVGMTTSAFNAVVQYHNSTVEIVNEKFEKLLIAINNNSSDIHGLIQSLAVVRAGLSKLEKEKIVNNIQTQ